MRVLFKIALISVCAVLIAFREGRCDDVEALAPLEDGVETVSGRVDDHSDGKKDAKSSILPGAVRRSAIPNNVNTTREHLLSVLRERRKQVYNGRLAAHINTIASIASKPRNSTTFAQLEIRDPKNAIIRKITLDNSTPTIKVTTTNGTKETHQEIKPQEIKHLLPNLALFQENKSRAGFLNNRRKQTSDSSTEPVLVKNSEAGIIYIPPEGSNDKTPVLELDEDFQVDESNHGLYLLNYSDVDNVTTVPVSNDTNFVSGSEQRPNDLNITATLNTTYIQTSDGVSKNTSSAINNAKYDLVKPENEKEKENTTLFMSDEIYKHFQEIPLEADLPAEDMAPFKIFGQKLGSPISDNLTNSPTFSASTKSLNFIIPPPERRRYNSRYSAAEHKNKNTSASEDEVNEDMDVSVVKNIIEKNKVRNTVKGTAPARHVGLVSAYKRYSTTNTPPVYNNQSTIRPNFTEIISQNIKSNNLETISDESFNNNLRQNVTNLKDIFLNRINTTAAPRNSTRTYFNIRRRPPRGNLTTSTENTLTQTIESNPSTEKVSTPVYTAVVTSVSITSSMKRQNNTEAGNSTLDEANILNINTTEHANFNNNSDVKISSTTPKYHKQRIRIRTSTTESSITNNTPTSMAPLTSSLLSDEVTKLGFRNKSESISDQTDKLLTSSPNQHYAVVNASSSRPKKRKRRPTTTTTTTTFSPIEKTTEITFALLSSPVPVTTTQITETTQGTENTLSSVRFTSKSTLRSSSAPQTSTNRSINSEHNTTLLNTTLKVEYEEENTQNEEVVIEADKNYTASYILAGLGFLPVAAIIAFILRSILNKKTKELDTEYDGYFEDGEIKKESPITPVARPPLPTPTKPDQKWEFPRNKLRLQTLLGQGNFGQVWKAEADDLNGHDGLTRLVAVKSIKETASQKEKQELLHEIYIMQKIGTHPNVVTLLACCTEQEPYLLIMEYVMCGKLLTYLRERRSRPDRFSGSGALTSRDLTVFAYCVARGMDYIASKGIVHRDLAARNVLVDHNKLCKIADFGMSRAAGGAARGRHALPVRWMAPEALLYNVYSHHTDVWAFGILLWEIVTLGSTPYAAMSGREVLTAVTEGYRLERPPHCKPQLYRAMHACWHADASQRPTFATLKGQLAELLDNEPSEGNYVDLDSFYQESSVYSDPSAIIHDEEGLSAEYDRERRVFRELAKGPPSFDNRAFNLRDEELRNKFGIGTPRMGGFGIRDVTSFTERNFSDGEFNERSFTDKNFNDTNFTDRKDGKLSTSSFHRERERERERDNPIVSRNSFNGFPRIGTRDNHFQMSPDGRNKRVSEFECDI